MENGESKKRIVFLISLIILVLVFSIFSFGIYKSYKKTKKVLPKEEKERVIQQKKELEQKIAELKKKEEEAKQKEEILNQISAKEDVKVDGVEIQDLGNEKLVKNLEQKYEIKIPKKLILARSVESSELNFFVPDEEGDLICPAAKYFPSDLKIEVLDKKFLENEFFFSPPIKEAEKLSLEDWVKNYLKIFQASKEDINEDKDLKDLYKTFPPYFKKLGYQKIGENNFYKVRFFEVRGTDIPYDIYFLEKEGKIFAIWVGDWTEKIAGVEKIFDPEALTSCKVKIPQKEIEDYLNTFKLR
jgi:hypothetical protein